MILDLLAHSVDFKKDSQCFKDSFVCVVITVELVLLSTHNQFPYLKKSLTAKAGLMVTNNKLSTTYIIRAQS